MLEFFSLKMLKINKSQNMNQPKKKSPDKSSSKSSNSGIDVLLLLNLFNKYKAKIVKIRIIFYSYKS